MSPLDRQPEQARAYWRSLRELYAEHDVSPPASLDLDRPRAEPLAATRRDFIKLMGASLALAGLTLTGCCWPKEQIAPYASRPEGVTPGEPLSYATALELGGTAVGLLVTSYDGRPIKVEGNPGHPASLGAASALHQASVLELYDPDRSMYPVRREGGQAVHCAMDDFEAFAREHFAGLRERRGQGLAVLSEAAGGPTALDLKARLLAALPQARWYEYEPVSRDNARAGARLAFGQPYRAVLHLDRADIIVSLDDDLLLSHPDALRHARHYAARRSGDSEMNRLYAVESALSVTGAQADHRLPLAPGALRRFALELAAELHATLPIGLPSAGSLIPLLLKLRGSSSHDLLAHIARDLRKHRGRSLVTVGLGQPPALHALACVLNDALGSVGTAVTYVNDPEPLRVSHRESIAALIRALNAGEVDTLVILGGNPAYNAPAELAIALALAKAPTTVHLSLYDDETSHACRWQVPRAHYLESWGDARSWDGTLSVVQPLIAPLYGGLSNIELLARIAGDERLSGYDLVRRTLAGLRAGDAEVTWRETLHAGVLEGSQWPALKPALAPDPALAAALECYLQASSGSLELQFKPDASVYDGRFANNGWLQEQPDLITKITWDNAALLSLADAGQQGIKHGDIVSITAGDRTVELPACLVPGQAAGTVVLPLGYGRRHAGSVGSGVGTDAYRLRTSVAWDGGECTLRRTGRRYQFAEVQDHWTIDAVGAAERSRRAPLLVREANVDYYAAHPHFAAEMEHLPPLTSLWAEPGYPGHRWGMAIDLSACIGCGACITACVAENNIPVVGRERVREGREMHWLRVDRYFSGDPARPRSVSQPVACHHCELAPCEQVCPVAATVHSSEGLNDMVYNRCVGTRYCANNCPYKVRRFNYFNYRRRMSELARLAQNPEVTVRSRGVMEKCTYCVQRIQQAKIAAKNARRPLSDGEITPACAQTCPTGAIVFGDLSDPHSRVRQLHEHPRAYYLLAELNIKPRTAYLAKLRNPAPGTPEYELKPPVAHPVLDDHANDIAHDDGAREEEH